MKQQLLKNKVRVSLMMITLLLSITAKSQSTPTVAAPTPTNSPANVISLFSNTYTNVPVDTWLTGWSAAGSSTLQIAGNDTRVYTNLNFAGIEHTAANLINAKCMTHFNMHYYTSNMTVFRIKLVDFGANGVFQGSPNDDVEAELTFTPTLNSWNTLKIPLSTFAVAGLVNREHLAQMIFSGLPVATGTVYIDNVYYSKEPLAVSGATICSGQSHTINPVGVSSFTVTGSTTGSVVSPITTTNYTVVGTNTANCTLNGVVNVMVNPSPVISVAGTQTACLGQGVSLTASGANSYTWSTGATTNTVVVSPSVTSQYTVSGTSSGCNGSTTVAVNIVDCSGVNEANLASDVNVFPNPGNGQFTMQLSNSENSLVTVTNALGQVILVQKAETIIKFDISGYDKGLYFVRVVNTVSNAAFTTKVIIE